MKKDSIPGESLETFNDDIKFCADFAKKGNDRLTEMLIKHDLMGSVFSWDILGTQFCFSTVIDILEKIHKLLQGKDSK